MTIWKTLIIFGSFTVLALAQDIVVFLLDASDEIIASIAITQFLAFFGVLILWYFNRGEEELSTPKAG